MGLDMYLKRYRRIGNTTPDEAYALDCYYEWKEYQEKENYKGSLEKWCGVEESELNPKHIKKYEADYITRYNCTDTEHTHGYKTIMDSLGYWRKANSIHNWFVENVQGGEDNCGRYEVTEEQLQELLDTCKTVRNSCKLTSGQVTNGYSINNEGEFVPILEEGLVVVDSKVANDLLPTTNGCFFGNTEYNEWYVQDIDETIDILEKVLAETDFDEYVVFYRASW